MRIFHWKFGVIMPSCPHCVHNWLFMNYLYSDGKNVTLTYALMPSLFFGAEFHIIYLLSVIYPFYKSFRFNMK